MGCPEQGWSASLQACRSKRKAFEREGTGEAGLQTAQPRPLQSAEKGKGSDRGSQSLRGRSIPRHGVQSSAPRNGARPIHDRDRILAQEKRKTADSRRENGTDTQRG